MQFTTHFRPISSAIAIFVFVVARLGVLLAFYLFTDGKELASDVVFHRMIIDDPFGILNGTAKYIASYPPFQWVFEYPLFNLFSIYFGDMLSYRLMMLTIELLTFITLLICLHKNGVGERWWLLIVGLYILAPHQIFTTIFFVQEDIIGQLFILLAFLMLSTQRKLAAMLVLLVGVLAAKLYLIVPLFYVALFFGRRHLFVQASHFALALIPIVLIYYLTISNAISNGGHIPIVDFTPDAVYAANYWVVLLKAFPEKLDLFKYTSVLLTLVLQLVLTAVFYFYSKKGHTINAAVLLVLPLALFFATFYQQMPEYLLLIWPLIAFISRSVIYQLLVAAAMSFAWTPRVLHGIMNLKNKSGTSAEERAEIINPTIHSLSDLAGALHTPALIANTIVYSAVLITLLLLFFRSINYKRL